MQLHTLIFCLFFLFGLVTTARPQSPSTQQIVESLITKLLRICNQKQSINFLQCEQKLKQNDKKIGNFRNQYNYTRQSIYMMHVYDINQDGRLDRKQMFQIGLDVMQQKINEKKIDAVINKLETQQKNKQEIVAKSTKKEQNPQEQIKINDIEQQQL